MNLKVASSIPVTLEAQLEALFFFNQHQDRCLKGIKEEIARTGQPRMIERDGRLDICLDAVPEVQTYYFQDAGTDRLLGAALAHRVDGDCFRILHWAVSAPLAKGSAELSVQMLGDLRKVFGRINGITHLELPYPKGETRLKVRVP